MGIIDDVLKKRGITFEELRSGEREVLLNWAKNLESNPVTVETTRRYIKSLRLSIEKEIDEFNVQTPGSFITLASLFIPFYGLIKKWYMDEHRVFLEARLKNLRMIEAFLIGPIRAKKAIEQAVDNLANTMQAEDQLK